MKISPPALIDVIRALRLLLEPGGGRRWAAVAGFALLVTVLEVIATVMTLVLLRLVTQPAEDVRIPLVGNLSQMYPTLDRVDLIVYVAVATGLFFLIRGLMVLLHVYIQNRMVFRVGARLSTRLLQGYLAMPHRHHLQRSSAELVRNAYTSVNEVVVTFLLPTISLLTDTLLVLGILLVLSLTAPTATALIFVVIVPLIVILLRAVQPRLARVGARSQELNKRSLALMQQSLEGLRDIRVLRREAHFSSAFRGLRFEWARTQYERAVLADSPRVLVETTLFLFIVSYMVLTVRQDGTAAGSLAVLGLFAYAAIRLLPSLNRIVANVNNMRYGAAALEAVRQDLQVVADAAGATATSEQALPFLDRITFHNVAFSYDDVDEVLHDINLVIRRGDSLGVVGSTGAGKSTLVDLLLGFLTPTRGTVSVDDVPLRGKERSWFQNLGVVSQSVFMFDDTLRRNIAVGRTDDEIDDERVRSVARSAQLEGFIAELPLGLDTAVGERGVRLSGGQRQRVAIARALYEQPSVVIFDEGTSALDSRTEGDLMAAMERLRGDRTVITVAHRFNTVRNCDRIILLRAGRIAATGTYQELMQNNPEFRRLAGSGVDSAQDG